MKHLVAEWIHFTLFGKILPTIILKVYTFWGLGTQQLRTLNPYSITLIVTLKGTLYRTLKGPFNVRTNVEGPKP